MQNFGGETSCEAATRDTMIDMDW